MTKFYVRALLCVLLLTSCGDESDPAPEEPSMMSDGGDPGNANQNDNDNTSDGGNNNQNSNESDNSNDNSNDNDNDNQNSNTNDNNNVAAPVLVDFDDASSVTLSETDTLFPEVRLTLSGPAPPDGEVILTLSGSASPGVDYGVGANSMGIPIVDDEAVLPVEEGATSVTFLIFAVNDFDVEDNETIVITLGADDVTFTVPDPAPSIEVSLLSDDVTPVVFNFAADQDLALSEMDTTPRTVVIEFDGPVPAASDLRVNFNSFLADRADYGDDFVSEPAADEFNTLELAVAEGDTSASFTIAAVDDATWERAEVIPMSVFVPVIGGLTPGAVTETFGSVDSDDVVTVSFAGSSITVREGQIASFLPAIELSGPLSEPLPLQVSVSGTATYGMDYGIRDGNGIGLGFETGAELFPVPVESTLLRIRVEVINNPEVEPEEEIIIGIDLSLSDLPDVALGDITEFVATVQDATTP